MYQTIPMESATQTLCGGLSVRERLQNAQKESLSKRIERLRQVMPSDNNYGHYVVNALRRLLYTPLYELCGRDSSAIASLNASLVQAGAQYDTGRQTADGPNGVSPVYDGEPITSYVDALEMLSKLEKNRQQHFSEPSKRTLIQDQMKAVLVNLAHQLLRPPGRDSPSGGGGTAVCLKERLENLGPKADMDLLLRAAPPFSWPNIVAEGIRQQQYSILCMPLVHYICAAAKMDGTDYPLRLYRYLYMPKDDPNGVLQLRFNTAYAVKWALGELPDALEQKKTFVRLYNLLVEPLFPDENMERAIASKS